jgi:hypothetical protein
MALPEVSRSKARNPGGNRRDASILLRLTQDELERWKRLASTAGVTLSEWIRGKCAALLTGPDVPPEPMRKADKIVRKTDAAIKTSDRTGHPADCECFQCAQTARFLKQQATR